MSCVDCGREPATSYAGSSRAYLARSGFCPTSAKRTTSFVSFSRASYVRIVVEPLDAQHGADPELRMSNAHSELQGQAGRLIFVLIGVGRRALANLVAAAAAAGAVRIGPVLVETALVIPVARRRKGGGEA